MIVLIILSIMVTTMVASITVMVMVMTRAVRFMKIWNDAKMLSIINLEISWYAYTETNSPFITATINF